MWKYGKYGIYVKFDVAFEISGQCDNAEKYRFWRIMGTIYENSLDGGSLLVDKHWPPAQGTRSPHTLSCTIYGLVTKYTVTDNLLHYCLT